MEDGQKHTAILESFEGLRGRIGLFGGSFDPIQLGHMKAAELAQEAADLNKVIFIPARQNPLKNQPVVEDYHRINMLDIALTGREQMAFSTIEIELPPPSYTIDTLKIVKGAVDPSATLHLIIGSDCIADLDSWREIEEIGKTAQLITVPREEGVKLELAHLSPTLQDNIRANLVSTPSIPLSSTEIRDALANGIVAYDLLPDGVGDYIEQNLC